MRGVSLENHIGFLREAVSQCSVPVSIEDVASLIESIRRQPDSPPKNPGLWSVFAYVRACIVGGIPESWLDEEILKKVSPSRETIRAEEFQQQSERKRQELDEYFLRQHMVCKHARAAASKEQIQYLMLKPGMLEDPNFARGELRKIMEDFVKEGKKRVLVIGFAETFDTHTQANVAAKVAFLNLNFACKEMAYPDLSDDQHSQGVALKHFRALSTPDGLIEEPLVPYAGEKNDEIFFVFAANNLYEPNHPRYAPHPVMIITYNKDIIEARNNDPAGTGRIMGNALTGIAHRFVPHIPIEDLRANVKTEKTGRKGPDNRDLYSVSTTLIPPLLNTFVGKNFKKLLYEYPIPEEEAKFLAKINFI